MELFSTQVSTVVQTVVRHAVEEGHDQRSLQWKHVNSGVNLGGPSWYPGKTAGVHASGLLMMLQDHLRTEHKESEPAIASRKTAKQQGGQLVKMLQGDLQELSKTESNVSLTHATQASYERILQKHSNSDSNLWGHLSLRRSSSSVTSTVLLPEPLARIHGASGG